MNNITVDQVMQKVEYKKEYYAVVKQMYLLTKEFVQTHEGQAINKRIETWLKKQVNDESLTISYSVQFNHMIISVWQYRGKNPLLKYDRAFRICLGHNYSWNDLEDSQYNVERLDKDNYWENHIDEYIAKVDKITIEVATKLVEYHDSLLQEIELYNTTLESLDLYYSDLLDIRVR